MLPRQGAWVRLLVRELRPSMQQHSQINFFNKFKKKSKQGELLPNPSKRLLLADNAFILGNFLYQ